MSQKPGPSDTPSLAARAASAPPPPAAPPAKAHEYAAQRNWPGYYDAVEGKPARDTLLLALELFEKEPLAAGAPAANPVNPGLAIDLGCGTGRDALELLNRGWRVYATDSSAEAFTRLVPRLPPVHRDRFEFTTAPFESLDLPRARLVNASYALPFCSPTAFPALWQKIVAAIPPSGRFAGQFFGERDDWAILPDRTHHTRSQVDRLLADFIIDRLQEVENMETGTTGEIKHWHIFHVVARKRG